MEPSPVTQHAAPRPVAAHLSWMCFLGAQVFAALAARKQLPVDAIAAGLCGIGAFFAIRAARRGPMKGLGLMMLFFNLLLLGAVAFLWQSRHP